MSGISYTIGLIDRMSGPSRQASSSIRGLTDNLKAAKTQLAGFQQQLGRAGKLGDTGGVAMYGALVDVTRRKVYELQGAVEKAGGGQGVAGFSAGLGPLALGVTVATTALTAMAAAESGPAWVSFGSKLGISIF